jgi:hypothetical protein
MPGIDENHHLFGILSYKEMGEVTKRMGRRYVLRRH